MTDIPKWRRFEHLIHALHEQYGGESAMITLDDHIEGKDSKTIRQVDISILGQIGSYSILIVIDCKDYSVPLDVNDVGAFATLCKDIRANKGVMISTSGYTKAAVEIARTYGIDTRTYLDTESEEWGTVVTIPILLDSTQLTAYQFSFRGLTSPPFSGFEVRTNIPPYAIEVRLPEGGDNIPLMALLGRKWNHDDSLHIPGTHTVTLCENATIDPMCGSGRANISANVVVEKRLYSGPLGIHIKGFRDEQNASIIGRQMETDFIDAGAIERGRVPGWQEIVEYRNHMMSTNKDPGAKTLTVDGVPVGAMFVFGVVTALPETRQEFADWEQIESGGRRSPTL